jgi:hypothetical protein
MNMLDGASLGDLGLLYRGLSCWRLTDTPWGFVSLCASSSPLMPLVLASESSCLLLPFDLTLMPSLAL